MHLLNCVCSRSSACVLWCKVPDAGHVVPGGRQLSVWAEKGEEAAEGAWGRACLVCEAGHRVPLAAGDRLLLGALLQRPCLCPFWRPSRD